MEVSVNWRKKKRRYDNINLITKNLLRRLLTCESDNIIVKYDSRFHTNWKMDFDQNIENVELTKKYF